MTKRPKRAQPVAGTEPDGRAPDDVRAGQGVDPAGGDLQHPVVEHPAVVDDPYEAHVSNLDQGAAAGFDLPPAAEGGKSRATNRADVQQPVDAEIFSPVPSAIADKHRPTKRRRETGASEPLKLVPVSSITLKEGKPGVSLGGFQGLKETSKDELRADWGSRLTPEQAMLLDVLAGSRAASLLFDSLVNKLGDSPSEADVLICRVLATRLTIGNLYQLQVRRFIEAGKRAGGSGPVEPQPWRVE